MKSRVLDQANSFIDALARLHQSENRGALARLRLSLAREDRLAAALPVIYRMLPEDLSEAYLHDYALVAGLFALHTPQRITNESFAKALYRLAERLGAGRGSLDQRVAALLNSEKEDLPVCLRGTLQFLRSKEIEVDYALLLRDLIYWDEPNRDVQEKWARDYYSQKSEPEKKNEN